MSRTAVTTRKPAKRPKPAAAVARTKAEKGLRDSILSGHVPEMPAMAKRALLMHAIERRAKPDGGTRSSAYELGEAIQWGIASAVVLEHTPAAEVVRAFADDLRGAGVSAKAVITWLGEVRRDYLQLHADRAKQYYRTAEAAKFGGNVEAVMDAIIAQAAPVALALIGEIEEADAEGRYPIARLLEVIIKACDVFGGVSQRVAQTKKLNLALDKAIKEAAQARDEGKKIDLDQIARRVREEAGLADPAPVRKEAA